jgi:hypothetical protein
MLLNILWHCIQDQTVPLKVIGYVPSVVTLTLHFEVLAICASVVLQNQLRWYDMEMALLQDHSLYHRDHLQMAVGPVNHVGMLTIHSAQSATGGIVVLTSQQRQNLAMVPTPQHWHLIRFVESSIVSCYR